MNNDLDDRLTHLEIKASFMEDMLDQLDTVIIRQQAQIDTLLREVQHLRQAQPEPGQTAARNLRDELPPHY
jgi:SlyX protein